MSVRMSTCVHGTFWCALMVFNPLHSHSKSVLVQYKVPNSGLEKRTLCLSVWDDNFGRNKFLGQVKVPLSEVDLSQRRDRWMTLMEK